MTSQILCQYTAVAAGAISAATLSTLMGAVPVDNDFLVNYGLRVTADSMGTLGNTVTRSITLSMVPSLSAVAIVTLEGGEQPSKVQTVSMSSAGTDYVAPPVIGFSAPAAGSVQALGHANLGVQTVSVTLGGAAYSAQSVAVFTGGGATLSQQATATLTIVGGVVIAVTVTGAGGPYGRIPTVTVVDPTGAGSGAVLAAHLGVQSVTVDAQGNGYPPSATCNVVALFKAMFPDSSDQAAPVKAWMQGVLQQSLNMPIVALVPVVS